MGLQPRMSLPLLRGSISQLVVEGGMYDFHGALRSAS